MKKYRKNIIYIYILYIYIYIYTEENQKIMDDLTLI